MYLSVSALPCASGKKKESLLSQALSCCSQERNGLLAQAARDVAENVLDLVAEDDQDYDHDHRDQDEDKGVLDHTLPFLTVEQSAKLEIKVGQHADSPPCGAVRTGPSFTLARVQINECRAEERLRSFDGSVTVRAFLAMRVTTAACPTSACRLKSRLLLRSHDPVANESRGFPSPARRAHASRAAPGSCSCAGWPRFGPRRIPGRRP